MRRKLPAEANIFFHLSIGLVYQSEGEDDLAFAEFMVRACSGGDVMRSAVFLHINFFA